MTSPTTGMARFTWSEVCARRLRRHGLADPLAAEQLANQVGVMCGTHAQIMSAAELSIGLRIEGTTHVDVQDALWNRHSLIKTYGPRGTVHLLRAQDLPMWAGALSALPVNRNSQAKDVLLTPEQTDEVIAAIATVLSNAELTIDELSEAVVSIVGSWAGDPVMPAFQGMWARWRQAMSTAANRGALCFGANRGRNVTYTNPRRFLPGFEPADGQTALADLVKRYLYAYGPATSQQFAQWLSAPRRWAAELFESLASELESVLVEDTVAWVVAGDTRALEEPPHGLRLLPYFDVYGVGCFPREKVFPGRASERALARGQAGNFPLLLIDGVVGGIWHQRRSGKKIAVTVDSFNPLTESQHRELDDQVERIGEIQEGKPTLTMGEVTIGPHA